MNLALRVGYEGVAQLARALTFVAPAGRNKLLDTFAARRGISARYEAFARDPAHPLLWMHAPSVGEGLQARPVLELARDRMPRTQLAYTYFSPSARQFANRLSVDFRDVLPFDDVPDVRRALRALSPTAIVFSKLDVWPTLAREAASRGTRLGLISATLSPRSSRRSGVARLVLQDAYQRLDRVGAISSEDAERLTDIGVDPNRVSVTGDTRYDQVWARAAAIDPSSPLLAPLVSDRPTLVAGSTWPTDEHVLLKAWSHSRLRGAGIRLIIAPHEPTSTHLASIERWGATADVRLARLSAPAAAGADVILVDSVGVLGDLYALADAAFVGGGFHGAGLHSVLEPAAFGSPVLFGPQWSESRDARLLMEAGGGASISDAQSLAEILAKWLVSASGDRQSAGQAAQRAVARGLGAAERSYEIVRTLMEAS